MRVGWQILEVWSAPKHFPNPEAGTGTQQQTVSCNTSAKYVATVSGDASHLGWWNTNSSEKFAPVWSGSLIPPKSWKKERMEFRRCFCSEGGTWFCRSNCIYSSPSLTPHQNVLPTKANSSYRSGQLLEIKCHILRDFYMKCVSGVFKQEVLGVIFSCGFAV